MRYKLVVLGSSGAGKSALIMRLLQNRFVEQYVPTNRDTYQGQLMVDGEQCQLAILDTSGWEEFLDLWEDCVRWCHGFLFVYTVDSIQSFVDLSLFWQELQKVKGPAPVPMVLVANKVDEAHWMVDSDMGQEAARSFGMPYVETSAKTGQGVEQAFQELVREIRKFQARRDQGGSFTHCKIL